MKAILLGIALISSALWAQEEFGAFDLSELPQGVMVTLPHTAHTLAPVQLQLQVQASDRPQILKLSTLSQSGISETLKVMIYDQQAEAVQSLTLKPGATLLYHFRSLRPIRIVSVPKKPSPQAKNQKLLLESNRPLGVSHGTIAALPSAF